MSHDESKGWPPGPPDASARVIQTFRLPRPLVGYLKQEATRRKRDLTQHVVALLQGIRTYFGLPRAAVALLEADREALGMEPDEYLLHVLYERSAQLRDEARNAGSSPGKRMEAEGVDARPLGRLDDAGRAQPEGGGPAQSTSDGSSEASPSAQGEEATIAGEGAAAFAAGRAARRGTHG
jgi:hypothetical protein